MVNLNVRVLGNGAVLVQYSADGCSQDAGFVGWNEFITWLEVKRDAGELASEPYRPGDKK